MAQQKSVPFQLFDIRLGDGEAPETFTAPCALRSRGMNLTANNSEVALLDCSSPEAASWMTRNVVAQMASISGSGSLDPDDLSTWWEFFNNAAAKNVQVHVDKALADGGGYWQGPFILTTFNMTGSRDDNGGVVSFEVELMSAGRVTWTDAAA